ncbi:hypothetical protein MNBD_CHLOROFLEXI01-3669 [hydrothermal vent metagenome]|uniref:Uncharacterized protein n=1 Tax=hydrothermal vent metagenome TaxID=652676 RepID=A0A3B0VVC6_9ZZZZ
MKIAVYEAEIKQLCLRLQEQFQPGLYHFAWFCCPWQPYAS